MFYEKFHQNIWDESWRDVYMENQFIFYISSIKLNKTFINKKRVWFWYIKQISVQRDFSKRWNAFSSLCFQKILKGN